MRSYIYCLLAIIYLAQVGNLAANQYQNLQPEEEDSESLSHGRHLAGSTNLYQPGWSLIWNDEFTKMDTSKWSYQQGNGCEYGICGWGNGEAEYYTKRSTNVDVEGGHLILKARHDVSEDGAKSLRNVCRSRCKGRDNACKEGCNGVNFSSGRLRTAGRFSTKPGARGNNKIKITARFKVDAGMGLWPAIWMLPDSSSYTRCSGCGKYGRWARSGELDVMEAANEMREVRGTIHYGDVWPQNVQYGGAAAMVPGEWQVVSMIWQRKRIHWYLNGQHFASALSGNGTQNGWFSTGGKTPDAPFDQSFHLVVNLAIGGGFTGNIPQEVAAQTLAGAPKSFHIDYIRVYGRK